MTSLINKTMPSLLSHRLPNWDLDEEIICPYYSGYSFYNLPASICHWLDAYLNGAPLFHKTIHDVPAAPPEHIILVLVDGLGLDWFQNYLLAHKNKKNEDNVWNDILEKATIAPITSIAPSTTSTALTTLWTGRSPLEHGILGYELWLKEYGILSNMITLSPASFPGDFGSLKKAGFQPSTFLPCPSLGQHLSAHGIESSAFIPQAISRSSLSDMHLSGTKVMPYKTLSDLWLTLETMIKTRNSKRSFTCIYYSDLDTLSHHYGPGNERVTMEFTIFSIMLHQFINRLRNSGHRNTLMLLTADHGFIATPPNSDYELSNHPELINHLVMFPSGENRLPFLFIRPGKEKQVQDYIMQKWEGKFLPMNIDQVLASGLFGPLNLPVNNKQRLGDMVVIAKKDAYWWWANKPNPLHGRHGGLSRQEMLIPLIMLDL